MSRRSTIFVESDPDLDFHKIVKHRAELLIRGSFDDQTPDFFSFSPPMSNTHHTFTAMSSKFEVNWLRLLWNFWSCHWYHWWFGWIFWEGQEIGKVLVKLPGQLAKAPMSGSYDALCLAVMLRRNLQKDPRAQTSQGDNRRKKRKPWWKAAKMPRTGASNASPSLRSPNKPFCSYSNHRYSERMANLKPLSSSSSRKNMTISWKIHQRWRIATHDFHHGPQLGVFPLLCEPVPKPDVGWRQEFR